MDIARRAIEVTGIVHGVGFRPFVHGLARRLELGGSVRNFPGGVRIEVEGRAQEVERFLAELTERPPALARIEEVRSAPAAPCGETTFRISASDRSVEGIVTVSPDIATCDACLRELFDPSDRRHGYAFLNCTSCGPRLTIVTGAPYDRERTTMAAFVMCSACRAEYEDPDDRRFHAEPIACPRCGPALAASGSVGLPLPGDPLQRAADALRSGEIVAIKGLGGYHLACDARSEAVVAELRRRKRRDAKPFAVLVADLDAALEVCRLDAIERAALASPERPIVLARRRRRANVAPSVAPGMARLGIMLPHTPIQHLLVRELEALPLVMTSGNLSDEPVAHDDTAARERLGGVARVFLSHNRAIRMKCDDSVVQVIACAPVPLRRARGYAPAPLPLPAPLASPTLAAGGHLKATFALGAGGHATLSQHVGDLGDYRTLSEYLSSLDRYEQLFCMAPRRIVHDLHPDYASTRLAFERAERDGVELVAVQHHHAHVASCMAENGLVDRVVGVAFDGAGLGTDGAIWGGEFLVGDAADMIRAAQLRYVAMPGGEKAARQPWRMAVAHLLDAGEDPGPWPWRAGAAEVRAIEQMVARGFNAPRTSSVGRLFDAVAALTGVCEVASFEGQAPMLLESLALDVPDDGAYPLELDAGEPMVLDTRPLVREVAADVRRGVDPGRIARRFHAGLACAVVRTCRLLCAAHGCADVVLSGGVFANAILAGSVVEALSAEGLRPHVHRRVPPNDGGLCLGQLAIVAARDARGGA